MKKILKTLALATLGVFALASCEDVPAPYIVPGSSNGTPNADYIINQTFTSSLGEFQSESESGQISWKGDSRYGAIVSGYDDWDGTGTKTNKAGVTYLVSPEIDLTDVDSAYVTIEQAINYAKNTLAEDNKLMIRVGNGEWVELPMNYNGLGSSFTYSTQSIQIPQEYMGKKVQLGLKHTAHDTYSSTWEVKSLSVSKGQIPADSGQSGETPTGKEVTCAEAVELTKALADGATSTETYTVTGYITEVVGAVSNNQQTFWMADTKDGGKVFEAYYANLPEGVTEFKAGAKVKITGQLMKFVNKTSGQVTPEIKNATVEIIEDGGDTPAPTGTEVTCAQAVELTNALEDGATSTETYTITGYITEVVGSVSRNQQTFWMADTKDGGKVFEAYYANLPEGVTEFKAGAKVKITGQLTKYVNKNSGQVTPEIKNATVEILENGEGGETPTGTDVTCAQAVELTNALEDGATSTEVYSVTGYITEVVGNVSKNQQTFWMADTKDGGKVFEAYYANLPEGVTEFKAGMKVKITGNLMKYVKNEQVTPEIKNATVEILENGGDTPTPQPTGDADFTITSSDIQGGATGSVTLGTNAYGSQAVGTESTWYTFKTGDINWTGCRICVASASNGGGIQVQGNASDATKQGFIYNTSAFPAMQTIVVTTPSASQYAPTFTLYAGNEQNPSTVIEGESELQGEKTYIFTFEVGDKDYTYLKIWNNLVGVLYIDKIEVYTK